MVDYSQEILRKCYEEAHGQWEQLYKENMDLRSRCFGLTFLAIFFAGLFFYTIWRCASNG
jgi:hypothetical protein